jgi:hypothetical protein
MKNNMSEEIKPDYTPEELEQQAQVKKWLQEMFTFPRIQNEKVNEYVTGMASLLHASASMVIRTESRQREGMKSIEAMQQALLYYISSQAIDRDEK